jgi:hypothetical protein
MQREGTHSGNSGPEKRKKRRKGGVRSSWAEKKKKRKGIDSLRAEKMKERRGHGLRYYTPLPG